MRQYLSAKLCAALVAGLMVSQVQADVISTFDTDTDGWFKLPGSDAGSSVQWVSTGGNPDGFLQYNEVGSGFLDFVAAPAKFLGNKAGYYGGTLSFDIKTNTLSSPTNRNDQVKLIGDGIELRFELPNPSPLNEWHARSIDLVETAGWINTGDNQPPSQTEMLSVLGNLTALHLLTDYRSGTEKPSYDNIKLVPEPTTAALIGMVSPLALIRRRRRAKA